MCDGCVHLPAIVLGCSFSGAYGIELKQAELQQRFGAAVRLMLGPAKPSFRERKYHPLSLLVPAQAPACVGLTCRAQLCFQLEILTAGCFLGINASPRVGSWRG